VVLVGLLVRSVVRRKGTARVHGAGIPAASIGSPTEAGARRSRLTIAAEVAAIVGALVTIIAVLAGR
jgi:hypothetical protein